MTIVEALDILNHNKFWGYDTWAIGSEQKGAYPPKSYVLATRDGYMMTLATAIMLAETHPHDNGHGHVVELQAKPADVMKGWGFNAQTLLSFVANMTDAEKDQLVNLLWPAIAKRIPKSIENMFSSNPADHPDLFPPK